MSEEKSKKLSYTKELTQFYFAPELRSVATLLYLGIFGYMTLYYTDSLFVALKFLLYIVLGHTALSGIDHLFIGLAFIISLVLPFFISFYSIFVLHRIWQKPQWSLSIKWLITSGIVIGGILFIIISDSSARLAARQDVMRSFVEDAGLSDRI